MGSLRAVLGGTVLVTVIVAVFAGGTLLGLRLASRRDGGAPPLGAPCRLVDQAAVGRALGRRVTLQSGPGFGTLLVGGVDDRFLPAAPSCLGTTVTAGGASAADADAALVRVAVVTDDGAAATFAAGSSRADLSRAVRVEGLGDEAFCTGRSPSGAVGVLARRGPRLVYASVTAPEAAGSATDGRPAGCAAAAAVARVALGS